MLHTKPKNASGFFFFFPFFLTLEVPFLYILRSVQWLNAGNHWLEEEGTHREKKNGENGGRFSFWGGVSKEGKRERLSDINYTGCERYITPAIYLELLKMPIVNLRVYSCVSLLVGCVCVCMLVMHRLCGSRVADGWDGGPLLVSLGGQCNTREMQCSFQDQVTYP